LIKGCIGFPIFFEAHMCNYVKVIMKEVYQIVSLGTTQKCNSENARILGRHISTTGRDPRRNEGRRGDRPKQIQTLPTKRRMLASKAIKLMTELR